jgi:pimeloyl-ACP methyl ester carboxylesterase
MIYSTGDRFVTRRAAEGTARHVAGPYRFEVIEGASHWLPDEHSDEVLRLLLPQLASA